MAKIILLLKIKIRASKLNFFLSDNLKRSRGRASRGDLQLLLTLGLCSAALLFDRVNDLGDRARHLVGLRFLDAENFPDLEANGSAHRRWHGVANLKCQDNRKLEFLFNKIKPKPQRTPSNGRYL